MSTSQHPLPTQPSAHWYPANPVQTQAQRPNDTGRIVFTRQLWQRTMPDKNQSEQSVLNQSHIGQSQSARDNNISSSRRTSSTVSLRSRNHSPSPSRGSKTPLTPEESPQFRTTRKRSAAFVEQEDNSLNSPDETQAHSRANSSESTVHVCICQPDPKIPRPRNAFILYRQHHQANVVARNSGLANPEISKIIGEQWQNQPPEEKNRWKALAEEEKLRHQQQYPTYRYQPRRNGRRNSLSSDTPGSAGQKPKCQKCGGRTILTPSTASSGATNHSVPPTPGSSSIVTPVTRTLPVLRDLSLQSPAGGRMGRSYPKNMSPNRDSYADERDDVGPLSPDNKRRRLNVDHAGTVQRVAPPRYSVAPPGVALGPGTPFPFGQALQPHPYPAAAVHTRREGLPGIRGVVSPPGPMPPPPRPGMGYQQHRLSQGHIAHDRSLTLPPLQTNRQGGPAIVPSTGQTAEEQIMNIGFRYKVKVLSQVAPPAANSQEAPRGPLIAVEGDSAQSAQELANWLQDTLNNGTDLAGKLLDGPDVSANGAKEEVMAQYHRLAAEWLGKSKDLLDTISMKPTGQTRADVPMADTAQVRSPKSSRQIDENYDDASEKSSKDDTMQDEQKEDKDNSNSSIPGAVEKMDVDDSQILASTDVDVNRSKATSVKPVAIIPNYSLHTSNVFACLIPIGSNDPYSPNDHWQWTATQWRGIVGPDLTIYVRDAIAGESGRPSVEIESVDGRPDMGLFIVRRSKIDGNGAKEAGMEVDASVLRRVGFEVSEWVRAFSAKYN